MRHIFAVAVSSVIGGVFAWKISGDFWWIGVLVAGSIAYFLGELREIPEAWQVAKQYLLALKPKERFWYRLAIGGLSALSTLIVMLGTLSFLIYGIGIAKPEANEVLVAFTCLGALITVACILPALYLKNLSKDYLPIAKDIRVFENEYLSASLFIFLLLVGFLLLFFYEGIYKRLLKPLPRFLKTFFLYIHSRKRMLRFLDASIVTVVTYFFVSTLPQILITSFLGGIIIGSFHYYLVSVRLLGLKPNGD